MKKRVVSAVIALLITIPLVYKGGIIFYIFALILGLVGLREILKLFIKKMTTRFIGYISFILLMLPNIFKTEFINIIDYKVLGLTILFICLNALLNHKDKEFNTNSCFTLLGIVLLLSTAFSSLIILRNMSLLYFIFIFIISITNDMFAHSIGTLFGKHKINEISPKKSWEGCLGGLFFGVLISSLFYLILINSEINIITLILITLLLSIIGQLGDLFFSLVKRNNNIKDFSNIMPGHGGVLDRLDSVIFISLAISYFIHLL